MIMYGKLLAEIAFINPAPYVMISAYIIFVWTQESAKKQSWFRKDGYEFSKCILFRNLIALRMVK